MEVQDSLHETLRITIISDKFQVTPAIYAHLKCTIDIRKVLKRIGQVMLTFIVLSLFAFFIFWLIGYGFVNKLSANSQFSNEISVILGFAILTFTSYLIAYFRVSVWIFLGIVFIAIFWSLVRIWNMKDLNYFSYGINNLLKQFVIFSIGSATYAITHCSSLLSLKFHLRTGPDLMGWTISANYFKQNNNLEILWASITSQLSSTNRSELFSGTNSAHSVYSLASFNEQVSAEFLIGSNRVGLPALVGFITRFTDLPAFTLLWALVCCFGGVISLVTFKFLNKKTIPNIARNAGVVAMVGSTAVIAPIVEGGIWQIFIIPCLLIGLVSLYEIQFENRSHDLSVTVFAASMLAISLTSDVLIVIMPLVMLSLVVYLFKRTFKSLIHTIIAFVLPLLFGVTILSESLLARSRDALVGGWDAAGLPLLADVYGLTPWQEPTGRFNGELFNSPAKILLSSLLTLSIFILIAKGNNWGRNLTFLYLLFSTIIVSFSYIPRLLNGSGNNYIPWKLAFLFGVTFPIIICSLVESKRITDSTSNLIPKHLQTKKRFKKDSMIEVRISDNKKLVIWLILLLEMLQFARFQSDWFANSNSNAPISFATNSTKSDLYQKTELILSRYDFVGTCVPWFTTISLSGDLRSQSLRGASIQPRESIPARKKAFALDPSVIGCQKYSDLFAASSPVALLGSIQIFDVTSRLG